MVVLGASRLLRNKQSRGEYTRSTNGWLWKFLNISAHTNWLQEKAVEQTSALKSRYTHKRSHTHAHAHAHTCEFEYWRARLTLVAVGRLDEGLPGKDGGHCRTDICQIIHCNTHWNQHCNTHCNTHCYTQCNAHCNTLHHTACRTAGTVERDMSQTIHCNTHCNATHTATHTATYCNTLQHTAWST